MDVSRLAQIIWLDAGKKADITGNESLSPAVIQNGFSITSQINHSMAILPANNNVISEHSRKLSLVKDFRINERKIIDNETVDLSNLKIAYAVPTAQKVKTNIFAAAVKNILHWSPLDRFSTVAKIKAEPRDTMHVAYKAEAKVEMPASAKVANAAIVYDDNVVPFKRKILTLAS